MPSRGLLGRISGGGSTDEVESILQHLRALLNTRQGSAPCAPAFGVVDLADMVHAFPAAGQQVARAIKATITDYEPRLRGVQVRHVPDDAGLVLRFEISAQLADVRAGRTLRFATTLRPGGRFDVAG
jgi:type VI secretion system protein